MLAAFSVLLMPASKAAKAFSLSSFFESAVQTASASATARNSQTITLLSPAVNLDPNPQKGESDIAVVGGSALKAETGPSGTAADIEEWPTSSQISTYTVRPGDTLSSIAAMFDVSVNTIVWANDIQGGVIHQGQSLVILPIVGVRHTVAKGDTLASLAKKYKADADEIAQYNGLDPKAGLSLGTVVIIPNGELSSSGTAKAKPSTKAGSRKVPSSEPYLGGSGPTYDGYYVWPIAYGQITQGLHGWNGVDIGAPTGTGIYAAAAGTVVVARSGGYNGGYGSYVVIQHANGTQTLYGHASKILVSAGSYVAQGQTIALVGATGLSTGPHLHFEVRGAKNPFADLPIGARE